MSGIARRGDKLSEHIIWAAKDFFLEMGFERASMDMVASRAECSKRSLYAYYPSKEKPFIGVFELVRGMLLRELKMPAGYASDPLEAMVIFRVRYLEILTFERSMQMCRVSMAETKRFPEGGLHFFEAMFSNVQARLSKHVASAFGLSAESADEAADFVLGQVLHPKLMRALLGIDELAPKFGEEGLSEGFDLVPVRKSVERFVRVWVE